MDPVKVGEAIRAVRKRRGLTQHDLAEKINVTDKAVSRWERGVGLPDISIITDLAWNLNIDVNNLLEGNIAFLEDNWMGILSADRFHLDIPVSSSVYDKPLIHIWLSYFVLAGISTVFIVGTSEINNAIYALIGDGHRYGLTLYYTQKYQPVPDANYLVVCDSLFLYGNGLTRILQRGMAYRKGISELVIPNRIDESNKVLKMDNRSRLFDANDTLESYLCLPIYTVPAQESHKIGELRRNDRPGEEIISNKIIIGKGMIGCTLHDMDELLDISGFIRFIQSRTGYLVYCLEEICWRRGLISGDEMIGLADNDDRKKAYCKGLLAK